jgi:NAD-dependent DNA ligase
MTCPQNCCIGITGTLETMTQETAIRLIHEAGCAYAFTINENTTCLIVGKNPSGRDLMDAERYQIRIVWEDQFAEKVVNSRCGQRDSGL